MSGLWLCAALLLAGPLAQGVLIEQPVRLRPAQSSVLAGPVEQYSGYFTLERTHDVHIFYLFFGARSGAVDAPLVLWMTGGPGCSSGAPEQPRV